MDNNILERIIHFLNDIDIKVVPTKLCDATFLPGLKLKGQSILMDESKLEYPGDLLHEAGHIAVTEECLRPHIGTDRIGENWPSQGDEIVAILWSYAALSHLQLAPEVVFHNHGYRNASSWFVENFTNGIYMGLPLLNWMGMCDDNEFPKMKKWLR